MTIQVEGARIPRRESRDRPGAWCPEEDTRDNVRARRNVLAGLWAGKLLGFSGARLTAYAVEVHFADYEAIGDGDIVRKITSDLHCAGLTVGQSGVWSQLNVFHRDALLQTHVTD